ncbi:uncharacterized protein LOC111866586 isoform X3 [Cryptotermes secundus]|uniref:uncharacterized protein LOC111866586 isoform X3 n=1 Tax=Cryptotermes secundus TaxID=105785 RepID=UPI000CD7B98D|nr:uncharacterized protein LOC111866586 isoform X3 [Cryptotermes secundus]
MLEVIGERRALHRRHLHILLQEQIQNINLSCGTGDAYHGFEFMKERCKNLRKLNVSYLRHMNPNVLMGLVPCFSKLVSLNLRMTLTVDQVMDLVENWDRGLETRLFMSAGVRLSAEPTKPPSRLPLTTLVSVAEHVRIQSLETAARLCPETRTVTLSNAWLPSTALYKLMVMEHLTSLSLTNCEGLTLDFQEGVLPLLAVCGERLQSLILANFTYVDIAGIGRACLDLQNLAFSNIAEYEPVGQPCDEWFNQLHALELWSDPHADLSPYMIRQLLLFSPNMTNMLFKGCEILSDKLMTSIWEVNPMPKLSHLTLDHCHTITGKVLQHVLNADNELTVLRVWSCLNITKCIHTELVHHIKNENLDVYFEWFEYDD